MYMYEYLYTYTECLPMVHETGVQPLVESYLRLKNSTGCGLAKHSTL